MTIEKVIKDNTAALIALTEAVGNLLPTMSGTHPLAKFTGSISPAPAEVEETTAPVEEEVVVEELKDPKLTEEEVEEITEFVEKKDEPTIADASALTIEFFKAKGRESTVTILGKFGVTKAAELKQDQIADYIALVKLSMGEA